jgi:hypothetical protein
MGVVTFPTRTDHIRRGRCDRRNADQRSRWSDTSRPNQFALDGGEDQGPAPPDRTARRGATGPVEQTSRGQCDVLVPGSHHVLPSVHQAVTRDDCGRRENVVRLCPSKQSRISTRSFRDHRFDTHLDECWRSLGAPDYSGTVRPHEARTSRRGRAAAPSSRTRTAPLSVTVHDHARIRSDPRSVDHHNVIMRVHPVSLDVPRTPNSGELHYGPSGPRLRTRR